MDHFNYDAGRLCCEQVPVERIADEVAIIHEGKLRLRGSLESVKKDFKKLRVIYPNVVPEVFPVEGIVRADRNHHQALLTVQKYDPVMDEALMAAGAETIEVLDLSLEEIFVEMVKGQRQAGSAADSAGAPAGPEALADTAKTGSDGA